MSKKRKIVLTEQKSPKNMTSYLSDADAFSTLTPRTVGEKLNREEHERALKRIEALWDVKQDTPGAEELERLISLVEDHEEQVCFIGQPSSSAAKLFRTEQQHDAKDKTL